MTWPLGGSANQIVAITNQDGRLEVFYIGTDTALYHNWQVVANDSWNGETPWGLRLANCGGSKTRTRDWRFSMWGRTK